MARREKEIPIVDVKLSYVGTEDDFMKFLRAVVIEYLTENIIYPQDELHKNSA